MLITKFSIFEGAMSGNDAHLDEGILDNVRNFLSKAFGGKIAKLDGLINKFEQNESDYWVKWADATVAKNKAETERYEGGYDTSRQQYDDLIERSEKLLREIEDEKTAINDSLTRQANLIIKENARLRAYFDMKKAKSDERVAHSNYQQMKKEADAKSIEEMYKQYVKKNDEFKKFEETFNTKFSNMSGSTDVPVSSVVKKLGLANNEEVSMSLDEYKAMVDERDKNDIDGIYKVLERDIKKARERRDDEIKRIKATVNQTGTRLDVARGNREAAKFSEQADDVITSLEKKADYLFKLINVGTPTATIKKEIKENPEIVTDTTPKEIDVDKAVDKAIENTVKRVENPTPKSAIKTIEINASKFFDTGREQVEDFSGEKISDINFKHLKNDLINLFGKLTFFYKHNNNETKSKSLGYNLLAFAADIYKYKKQQKILGRDLSDKELQKKFDEYESQNA